MVEDRDGTYIAGDIAVPLNLLIYRCVIRQRVTSRHEVLVGLLVPALGGFKEIMVR